jgi:hypothetical protein
VHGGQNPVSGATIQLYTVGTTADGSGSTPILTKTVKTLDDGSFDITNAYSCTGATEVYLTATSGDPDVGIANPNLALMVALGPCTSVPSMSYIEVNELTTVAAVNALTPYMKSYTAVGSGSSDVAAMQAAFTLADEYVDPSTGTAPGRGVPSGYSVPVAEIDTLGNIAAACVNSGGGSAGQQNACGTLFSLTTSSGMTPPTDTIGAMLYLAKNPALNTVPLFKTQPKDAPFQPELSVAPANFAVALDQALTVGSLELTSSSVAFPATPVGGTSASRSMALINVGSSPAAITSITVTGANLGDFAETNQCPAMLDSNEGCVINVVFSPSSPTGRNASLQVNASALSIPLSGAGQTAGLGPVTLSPATLIFTNPSYPILNPQLITVTNTGVLPVGIQAIQLNSAQFGQTNTCGGVLAAQASCYIAVSSLSPSGVFTGTLTLVDTDTADTQTVGLENHAPVPVAGAKFWDFGAGASFAGYSLDYITVEAPFQQYSNGANYYSDQLTFQDPQGDGSYFGAGSGPNQNGDGCLVVVGSSTPDSPTSQPCAFEVQFGGTAEREIYGLATDTAGNDYFFKGFAGTNYNSFLPSPGVINFGDLPVGGASSPGLPLAFYNTGASEISYQFATLSGANASDFSVIQNTSNQYSPCEAVSPAFAAGSATNGFLQSCVPVTVYFAPADYGPRTAVLTLQAGGVSQTILLQGAGVYPNSSTYAPTFAQTSYDLGDSVKVGTAGPAQNIVVTMVNQDAASAQISGPFELTGPATCAASVSPCQFSVSFAPTSLGPQTGSLNVTDTNTGVSSSVSLTGTADQTMATLSFSPTSLVFAPRIIGDSSDPEQLTLTNTGEYAVTLGQVSVAGTNADDYSQTNGCTFATLFPSQSCTVVVTYTPQVSGPSSASIVITTQYGVDPNTVSLSGTGEEAP